MATHTWFDFGESALTYRLRDNSGDHTFEVEYGAIPYERRSVFDRNQWLRNVGLIWCALGVIEVGMAMSGMRSFSGSAFWLMIGLGCLAFYRLTWSEYTVFDSEEGSIWVLKDKSHDEIQSKLDDERKRHLLAWYRGIDFGGDAEQEIRTIEWLVKRKALSSNEASAQISEIKSKQPLLESESDDDVNKKLH